MADIVQFIAGYPLYNKSLKMFECGRLTNDEVANWLAYSPYIMHGQGHVVTSSSRSQSVTAQEGAENLEAGNVINQNLNKTSLEIRFTFAAGNYIVRFIASDSISIQQLYEGIFRYSVLNFIKGVFNIDIENSKSLRCHVITDEADLSPFSFM